MEQKKTLSAELDRLREEAYAEEAEHEAEHEHEHEHHHDHEHEHGHECSCGCDHDHDADEVFTSWGCETPRKYTEAEIRSTLSALVQEEYGTVLRAKGIVPGAKGAWIHFDYVPGELDIRTGSAGVTGRLCVIGAELDEDALAELFHL